MPDILRIPSGWHARHSLVFPTISVLLVRATLLASVTSKRTKALRRLMRLYTSHRVWLRHITVAPLHKHFFPQCTKSKKHTNTCSTFENKQLHCSVRQTTSFSRRCKVEPTFRFQRSSLNDFRSSRWWRISTACTTLSIYWVSTTLHIALSSCNRRQVSSTCSLLTSHTKLRSTTVHSNSTRASINRRCFVYTNGSLERKYWEKKPSGRTWGGGRCWKWKPMSKKTLKQAARIREAQYSGATKRQWQNKI